MSLASPLPSLEQFNQLLVALYNGPRENPPWSDFLRQLRELLAARYTVLNLARPRPGDPGITFIGGMEVDGTSELQYANDYSALDPFLNLPDGEAVTLEDMLPVAELRESPFYREFLQPSDTVQMLGIDILRGDTVGIFLRASRGERDKPFDDGDKALLNLLGPHLRQLLAWLDRDQRQHLERGLYDGIASRLEMGMVMLDRQGKVTHANPVAGHILEQGDVLRLRNGRLVAARGGDNRRLQDLLRPAEAPTSPALARALTLKGEEPGPDRTRQELFLLVKPLKANKPSGDGDSRLLVVDEEHAPRTAVYISTPEILTPEQQGILQQLFDFTPSEARLAIALANGMSLDQVAAELKVTRNTLRTHLRGAFQKAGVNQQSSLVSLVLRSVAGLG